MILEHGERLRRVPETVENKYPQKPPNKYQTCTRAPQTTSEALQDTRSALYSPLPLSKYVWRTRLLYGFEGTTL